MLFNFCLNCDIFYQKEDHDLSIEALLLKLASNLRVYLVQSTQPISSAVYKEDWGLVGPLPTTTQDFCWKSNLHIFSAVLAHYSSDGLGGPDSSVFCSGFSIYTCLAESQTLAESSFGSHTQTRPGTSWPTLRGLVVFQELLPTSKTRVIFPTFPGGHYHPNVSRVFQSHSKFSVIYTLLL